MYLSTETEEEFSHEDDPEQEIKYEEMLVDAGVLEETSEQTAQRLAKKAIEQTRVKMVMILCSCGSPKCGMIGHFGLPKPVCEAEILPIWSQMERDVKARRMKVSGA